MGKILLVIAVFALLVYGLFWLLERRRHKKSLRAHGKPPAVPRRTVGPDDDEEFLRQLEQRRRRAAREKKSQKPLDEDGRSGQDQPKPE